MTIVVRGQTEEQLGDVQLKRHQISISGPESVAFYKDWSFWNRLSCVAVSDTELGSSHSTGRDLDVSHSKLTVASSWSKDLRRPRAWIRCEALRGYFFSQFDKGINHCV